MRNLISDDNIYKLTAEPLLPRLKSTKTLETEDFESFRKEKIEQMVESQFLQDFEGWNQRGAVLPALPQSPISAFHKVNRLHGFVTKKEAALKQFQDQLESLQAIQRKADNQKSALYKLSELTESIASIDAKTNFLEGENSGYQEVAERLELGLWKQKKQASDLRADLETIRGKLGKMKENEVRESVENKQISGNCALAARFVTGLRSSRLQILSGRCPSLRLEETERAHETTLQLKDDHISRQVQEFREKEKIQIWQEKNQQIQAAKRQSDAIKRNDQATKNVLLDVKGQFESVFGTTDPKSVIGAFTQVIQRNELLRKEIEALLIDQDKGHKELEALRRQKDGLIDESVDVHVRDQMRTLRLKRFEESEIEEKIASGESSKRSFADLSIAFCTHIFELTLEMDPVSQLSANIDPKGNISLLFSLLGKRLETAIIISTQSNIIRLKSTRTFLRPRLSIIRPDAVKSEERLLKSQVFNGHFLDTGTEMRRASATIDSMLNSVASLLLVSTKYPRDSLKAHEQKRRKHWRNEVEPKGEDMLEDQEAGYLSDTRKVLKGKETLQEEKVTSPLRTVELSPENTSKKRLLRRYLSPKVNFSGIISDLRQAHRNVKKLKNTEGRYSLENRMLQTPQSTPSSSKTKDTSLAINSVLGNISGHRVLSQTDVV